jgi:hypothetical protein
MKDVWKEPSREQHAQCALASLDIIETVNRLIREGMDPRVVIAAIGSATANTITSVWGATAVAPWFDQQAKMVRDLQQPN